MPKGSDLRFGSDEGLSFSGEYKDGKFFAKSSDGQEIIAENNYDLQDKVAKEFKKQQKDPNKPVIVWFRTTNDLPGVSIEQQKKNFAKAFIYNGIIPEGDIPEDKKFWEDFKNEYLNNKDNTLEMWEKLTKHVQNDDEKHKTLNDGNRTLDKRSLDKLRGTNQPSPCKRTVSQINNNKGTRFERAEAVR